MNFFSSTDDEWNEHCVIFNKENVAKWMVYSLEEVVNRTERNIKLFKSFGFYYTAVTSDMLICDANLRFYFEMLFCDVILRC